MAKFRARRDSCGFDRGQNTARRDRGFIDLGPDSSEGVADIRRFLIHVLPDGFHRIRHYGLLANGNRTGNIALARRLLGGPDPPSSSGDSDGTENPHDDSGSNACPCCGGRMIILETFEPGCQPHLWPIPSIGLDSS
jgi:hypothetical protein